MVLHGLCFVRINVSKNPWDKSWHPCMLFKNGEFLVCNSAEVQTDEVNAIAALLGDLVAYRAVGWRHLEVLAGINLLSLFFPWIALMNHSLCNGQLSMMW